MDEQMTQQAQSQLSQTASPESSEPVNDTPEQTTGAGISIPEDAPEPEVSITEDGVVKFRDDFFGDIKDEPDEPEEQQKQAPEQPTEQKQTPNYYTDEELQNTPYDKWDTARMPEEVRRYAEALNRQREIQFRQQQVQQTAQNLPDFLVQPKQYTAKELNDEAVKIAAKNLGISVNDIDDYEGEHRAAVDMARMELLQAKSAEIANYQRQRIEFDQLQQFNANFVTQPDYNDFQKWYLDEVKSKNITHEQVLGELKELAKTRGFKAVQAFWGDVYNRFHSEKPKNTPSVQPQKQQPRAKVPPKLESANGGNYDTRKTYNLKDFGELSDDEQAQALMNMGIV